MSRDPAGHFWVGTDTLCAFFPAVPPLTFEENAEEELFKSVVEQTQLSLSCKVTRADGVVQWYKDGIQIQPGNNITMDAENNERSLTLHSAQLSDAGMYTCRAGDSILIFKVDVRGKKTFYGHGPS